MHPSISPRPRSRAASRHGFRPALERIDARLRRLYPEVEQQEIKKVMLPLFGPEPSGFSVPPGKPIRSSNPLKSGEIRGNQASRFFRVQFPDTPSIAQSNLPVTG